MNATNEAVITWLRAVAKTETARKALAEAETFQKTAAEAYDKAEQAIESVSVVAVTADVNARDAMARENTALTAARAAWVAENEEGREGSYED